MTSARARQPPSGEQHSLVPLYILSAAFFLVFASYFSVEGMVSTLVADNRLVNTALVSGYMCMALGAIISPWLVSRISVRKCLFFASAAYIPIFIAVVYPSFATLVPTYVLCGLGAGPLWTAQYIAVQHLALTHAGPGAQEATATKYNSIIMTAFQASGAVGLFFSSILLTFISDRRTAEQVLYFILCCVTAVGSGLLLLVKLPTPPARYSLAVADLGGDDTVATTGALADSGSGSSSHAAPRVASGGINQPLLQPKDSQNGIYSAAHEEDAAAGTPSLLAPILLLFRSRVMALMAVSLLYNGASMAFYFSMFPLSYRDYPGQLHLLDGKFVGFVTSGGLAFNAIFTRALDRVATRIGRRLVFVGAAAAHVVFYIVVYFIDINLINFGHETAASIALVALTGIVFALGDSVYEMLLPAICQSDTFLPAQADRKDSSAVKALLQPVGFALQYAIGAAYPDNVRVQLYFLFPLLMVATGTFWIMDRLQPIDTQSAAVLGQRGTVTESLVDSLQLNQVVSQARTDMSTGSLNANASDNFHAL